MSEKKVLSSEKVAKLYELLFNAFEFFKNNVPRKDKNAESLRKICEQLNKPKEYFSTISNIRLFSLFLIQPYEKCTNKVMEVILLNFEEIIKSKLLPTYILQEMSHILLRYIQQYFKENEIDFNVYNRILNCCVLIYTNNDLFIHNEDLKLILKICLRIYLTTRNKEKVQGIAQKAVHLILEKMLSKIRTGKGDKNQYSSAFYEEKSINPNTPTEEKKRILNDLALNEYKFVCGKYMNFLLDLIEIKEKVENNEKNSNNCIACNAIIFVM